MKAVIMAGGLGTRLRPLTCETPKPLLPVLNRPLMEHTFSLLKKHGCNELVLLLYYHAEKFIEYFGDGSRFDVAIEYISASEDLGTAGSVKNAAHLLEEPFYVLSGDALTNLDLEAFRRFHKQKEGVATIALASVTNPSPFGIAITNSENKITRFLEKPAPGQVFSDTVNIGIYLLEPEVLDHIDIGRESFFAHDIFPKLLSLNLPIFGYEGNCFWRDIGDLETYQKIHAEALNGKIDLGAKIKAGSLISENAEVNSKAKIETSVIGRGVKIGADANLVNSIFWDEVEIGENCTISNAVIANNCSISRNSTINENVFVSEHVKIGANSLINSNNKIWPRKIIEANSTVNTSLVWGERWRKELFGNSKVSGTANFEVTPEFSTKLGSAFGFWIGKGGKVLLSRDTSHVARMIYRSLITGLMSSGVDVSTIQVMPIPIVRHIMRTAPEKGSVHVRRSARDPNQIEILFFDGNGRDLTNSATKAIERIFYREDFPRAAIEEVGQIEYPVRAIDAYVRHFLNFVDIDLINKARFKIVLDYSFGAAIQVFPAILGHLDCEVLALNAHPDPKKVQLTKQQIEEALKQLSKVVKSTGADAGFLFDKGAEKIRVVDNRGNILTDNRLATLLTQLIVSSNSRIKIAAPVSAPRQIHEIVEKNNCDFVETGYESSAIIKATEDTNVKFAMNARGGFIFSDFHFAYDAMYTLTKILQYVAKTREPLSKLNKNLPESSCLQTVIACPWEKKGQVMRKMIEHSEGQQAVLIDGVKVQNVDSWVLVTPDSERALCHILVEAKRESKAKSLLAEYSTKVEKWCK